MRKFSFMLAVFFFFTVVIFIPRKPVHAVAPVAALPVFAAAVGDVTIASAAAAFGIVALVGAGCYGVYKLSQPGTQQAIKDWASSEVEAFQAGKTDWGVYVDSKGQYFMDNADKVKQDFNSKFNPDEQTQKDKFLIPMFPNMPSGSSSCPPYEDIFKNVTSNTLYVTVGVNYGGVTRAASVFTCTPIVPANSILRNHIMYVSGGKVSGSYMYIYDYINNSDCGVSFTDSKDESQDFNTDGYRIPFIISVISADGSQKYNMYPNPDTAIPTPSEFPDTSNSIQITPSTDPTTVTKDSDLTKVKPISQDQVKPTQATEPSNKTKPSDSDDTKDDDKNLPKDDDIKKIDWSPLKLSFQDKFPFCVPFDLINFVKSFKADRKAPSWHIQFPSVSFGGRSYFGDCAFDLDLGKFSKIAIILRYFLLVGFVVELIKKTRDLIRG